MTFICPLAPKSCEATLIHKDGTVEKNWTGIVGFSDRIEYFINILTGETLTTLEELRERGVDAIDMVLHQTVNINHDSSTQRLLGEVEKADPTQPPPIPVHPVGYIEAAPNTEEAYYNESCDSHVLNVENVLDRDRDTEDLNDPPTKAVLEVCKRAHRQGIKDLIVDYS